MSIYNLKKSIERLNETLSKIDQSTFSTEKKDLKKSFFSFKDRKQFYTQESIESNIKLIKESINELNDILKSKPVEKIKAIEIINTLDSLYSKKDFIRLKDSLNTLYEITSLVNIPQKELLFNKPKKIPEEIRSEILADINEIEKCFKFGCYRSAVIICGRILETALHRKYYELTNNDLLEKAPGIGLGKIIAKLDELNIKFDPGLTQQIHLINQMRIFSVHNKKEAFNPSEIQTHAIILYTLDIIEKLFKQ